MKLIECVPNISEGRNKEVINKITDTITSNNNVKLLDVDIGYDTNRTVITFIGTPDSVIEAAFSIMVLKKGEIPPTSNLETSDPECDLNYVPNKSIKTDTDTVMSNSLGFGGHNSSLIFRKFSS